ncbi:hypothetical protein QQP08_027715 [Theobroma cacao]|nr:hypothetical protein QQP08_027715 [Theobroma cacao]
MDICYKARVTHSLRREPLKRQPISVRLEEKRDVFFEQIIRAEPVRGGYEELDIGGATELLEELAAMAARGGGDGEVFKKRLRIEGEVGDKELLGVDGMVEG